MVVLDTSIIIDHLRSNRQSKSALLLLVEHQPQTMLGISIISIQELYEGQSTRIIEKEKDLLAVLGPLKILPYSYTIAQSAGRLARDRSQPIELADAAIAATAIAHNAQLYTLNRKDFIRIPELKLFTL